MKYDVYYRKNSEGSKTYDNIVDVLFNGKITNTRFDKMDRDQLKNEYDRYHSFKVQTVEDEHELAGFIITLHLNSDYSLSADNEYITDIQPHIEIEDLVMNTKTHEIRLVKDINRTTISLYNTDNYLNLSTQKYGYVRITNEEWEKKDCIVLDKKRLEDDGCYYPGSPLGTHAKYDENCCRDLCEL